MLTFAFAYWVTISVVFYFIIKKFNENAWMNVVGYEKIDGKWQKTMMPDNYTFPFMVGIYYVGATIICIGLWAISSLVLYYICPDVNTGFYSLLKCANTNLR